MQIELGKTLILAGVVLLLAGLALTFLPSLRLGRLPGDLVIRRGNWTFYLPIVTSILLSVLLSLGLWIFFNLRK